MADLAALSSAVSCYSAAEYPALAALRSEWQETRPLAGLRVLEATPLFRNTLVKHLTLVEAGAEVIAGYGNGIPYDPEIVRILPQCGISCQLNGSGGNFDVIFDCGGANSNTEARCGVVELTRSGAYHYENSTQKVFLADAGRVKLIETALGTGDGLVRGLRACGINIGPDTAVTVFGAGKVGRGILSNLVAAGCPCAVVDSPERLNGLPENILKVSRFELAEVDRQVSGSAIIVTATGIAGSLAEYPFLQKWAAMDIIFANMGVEDEFGEEIPAERVLNNKEPLNFILDEPTLLRYIDPTMALSNMGAMALLQGGLQPGLNIPGCDMEEKILADVRRKGIISREIALWEEMNGNV